MRVKHGFTLMECLVCTIAIGVLLVGSLPFLSAISVKQEANYERQANIITELSDINYALASVTYSELESRDTDRISIEKISGTSRLYKITGGISGVEVYWVEKWGIG